MIEMPKFFKKSYNTFLQKWQQKSSFYNILGEIYT